MKKLKLIKRKREIIIEVLQECLQKKDNGPDTFYIKSTSIVMISKRIDEFEMKIRKKMESEMRIFSSDTHSQKFLRSLVPSLRDKDE